MQKNEQTLELLHLKLCFLTQSKENILSAITSEKSQDLFRCKAAIEDNDLIGAHHNYFGKFDVKALAQQNPICFKLALN